MDEERPKRAVRALWFLLVAAAVVDARRRHCRYGELFGVIPYDFRVPTMERAKRHAWDPGSPRILTPTTFGVGWSVNLGRVARLAHLA